MFPTRSLIYNVLHKHLKCLWKTYVKIYYLKTELALWSFGLVSPPVKLISF